MNQVHRKKKFDVRKSKASKHSLLRDEAIDIDSTIYVSMDEAVRRQDIVQYANESLLYLHNTASMVSRRILQLAKCWLDLNRKDNH